jgi:tungstate transport system substrate-binding protein
MQRRRLLGTLALAAWPAMSIAQQRRSLIDPMRLGVDQALVDSGLAPALQRGFGRDTGVAVKLVAGAAQALLQALERGEIDAALTNAPRAESQLEDQGFVHDRVVVAESEFITVGPLIVVKTTGKAKTKSKPHDPAGMLGAASAAEALRKLRDAAGGDDSIRFLSANDGSGTHLAEQELWRSAQVAPHAPWYRNAQGSGSLIREARELGSYALVERGAWAVQGGAPLGVLIQNDPGLRVPVHFMRGFRNNHPAAKIYSKWIIGPKGRAIVAAQRGYRTPSS